MRRAFYINSYFYVLNNFINLKQLIMRPLILLLSLFFGSALGFAQSTLPTNVYPSNLEENMYFKAYDAKSNSIIGLNFLVLSDGNNSKDKTPAFEVTLYLMPLGKTSAEDITVIKVYQLDGIFHMGSHEFKNETISLDGITIAPGTYRLGVWVNSNAAFTEDTNDNATLFQGNIAISAAASTPKKVEEKKTEPTTPTEETEEEDAIIIQ